MPKVRFHALAAFLTALFCAALAAPLLAEPVTLSGRWNASPLTVKWIIGDWGPSCGPKPSGGGEPGATVVVNQSNGELTISGGGRTYSTAECFEQYPGVSRVGHSSSARAWKSTCKTSPADPRQATLSTSITATDDLLSFYEAGQYQFVIQGQNCTASVGRYRTYTLLQRAGTPEETPAASATPPGATATVGKPGAVPKPLNVPTPLTVQPGTKPEASPNDRCQNPGPPARLEVRPARKLLRAGEEFAFRALVYDAAGCSVFVRPSWSIEAGADLAQLVSAATVKVNPNASEGDVRLNVSVGGRSATVTIAVVSADRYENLLKSGAFNADGEVDEAATVAIASQSIGAASAVAEDHASDRKRLFVAVVGGVALLLAVAGIFLVRRTRRAAAALAARDAARRAELQRQAATAPTPPPETLDTPSDAVLSPPPVSSKRTICPVCGEQYAAESKFCGKDGAVLLPLN